MTLDPVGHGPAAIGYTIGLPWARTTAGWLFVCSAIVAWYVATAMMLQSVRGTAVLPVGRREPAGTSAPGAIQFRPDEPGIRHGQ